MFLFSFLHFLIFLPLLLYFLSVSIWATVLFRHLLCPPLVMYVVFSFIKIGFFFFFLQIFLASSEWLFWILRWDLLQNMVNWEAEYSIQEKKIIQILIHSENLKKNNLKITTKRENQREVTIKKKLNDNIACAVLHCSVPAIPQPV